MGCRGRGPRPSRGRLSWAPFVRAEARRVPGAGGPLRGWPLLDFGPPPPPPQLCSSSWEVTDRKKNSLVWKMTLLSIKPIAWGYSMITLGTEMLNSVFSFYYVKLFLHLYKISEVAFYQAQAVAVVIAILASASLYTGMYHMNRFEPKRSLEENLFSESEQDLPWTSVVSLMRQVLTQKNFCLFLVMNFFQVFHLTFFNNFMMIFADSLIPKDVLSSSIRSIMYGAGFICPQCLVLISQSWLKKFGYYKIILISFYLEGTASIVMLLLGQQYYYFLALYLTIIMVIVQASFCLFNLPLADMVDADLLKFNRQSPLSSMVFGINALFTKPAQSLAPMMILSKLKQYGYGNPDKSTILDLHDAMFNLICLVPLGIVLIQILVWSPFSIRNKTDYTGAL
ncbi:transmembrane protein 180-like isoform X8 [Canis lupus dingo]|uniref:transmembrane protein 180-like isoform X8 n=1 Tax=Canis lupus dingo TaxID=286419 RepID=UPI0020C5964C|nr:transmembrane protein 180-like isoform X8 [Canis lupus dingo]